MMKKEAGDRVIVTDEDRTVETTRAFLVEGQMVQVVRSDDSGREIVAYSMGFRGGAYYIFAPTGRHCGTFACLDAAVRHADQSRS